LTNAIIQDDAAKLIFFLQSSVPFHNHYYEVAAAAAATPEPFKNLLHQCIKNNGNLLHLAAGYNRPNCIKALIDGDWFKYNDTDNSGFTPLHYAAAAGAIASVDVLLWTREYDVDAHALTGAPNCRTAVMLATLGSHLHTLSCLLSHNATMVNVKEKQQGLSPLIIAILSYNDFRSSCSDTPVGLREWDMHIKARAKKECIMTLLQYGADANATSLLGMSPLQAALITSKEQEECHDADADENGCGATLALVTCLLADHNADPNQYGEIQGATRYNGNKLSPLELVMNMSERSGAAAAAAAARRGYLKRKLLMLLLQHGAVPRSVQLAGAVIQSLACHLSAWEFLSVLDVNQIRIFTSCPACYHDFCHTQPPLEFLPVSAVESMLEVAADGCAGLVWGSGGGGEGSKTELVWGRRHAYLVDMILASASHVISITNKAGLGKASTRKRIREVVMQCKGTKLLVALWKHTLELMDHAVHALKNGGFNGMLKEADKLSLAYRVGHLLSTFDRLSELWTCMGSREGGDLRDEWPCFDDEYGHGRGKHSNRRVKATHLTRTRGGGGATAASVNDGENENTNINLEVKHNKKEEDGGMAALQSSSRRAVLDLLIGTITKSSKAALNCFYFLLHKGYGPGIVSLENRRQLLQSRARCYLARNRTAAFPHHNASREPGCVLLALLSELLWAGVLEGGELGRRRPNADASSLISTLSHGLNVKFRGEPARGEGLLREWFELAAPDMMSPTIGVLCSFNDFKSYHLASVAASSQHDNNEDAAAKEEGLNNRQAEAEAERKKKLYTVIGCLVGMSIVNDLPLTGLYLTPCLWNALLSGPSYNASGGSSFEDIDDLLDTLKIRDPQLAASLHYIVYNPDDVAHMGLYFVTHCGSEGGRGEEGETELVPGGSTVLVTAANSRQYVTLLIRHVLNYDSLKEEVELVKAGMTGVLGMASMKSLGAAFTWKELNLVVGGEQRELNVADWRAHTVYQHCTADHPVVGWFWEVVEEMEDGDRRKLLKFATGCSVVPAGGGFGGLHRRGGGGGVLFGIGLVKRYGDERLPTASTCFSLLQMPENYSSKEVVKSRLMQAIHGADVFDEGAV
jgi:ankyrin repeat protein